MKYHEMTTGEYLQYSDACVGTNVWDGEPFKAGSKIKTFVGYECAYELISLLEKYPCEWTKEWALELVAFSEAEHESRA